MDDSKESPIFKARATHQTLWESLAGNREKEVRAACGTKRESGAAKWSSSKFSNTASELVPLWSPGRMSVALGSRA